jgi:hypothetical protein
MLETKILKEGAEKEVVIKLGMAFQAKRKRL